MSNLTNEGQKYTLEVALRGRAKVPQLYLALSNTALTKTSVLGNATPTEPLGGITAPGAPTVALAGAGAGNLSNGNYTYRVTFVTPDGETDGGTVSAVVTVADFTVNGQVSVSNIAVGPSHVTSRNLYRTVAGGATHRLLSTIANNTTTIFTDNVADGSLGANFPTVNSTGQKTPPSPAPIVGLAGLGAGNLSNGTYKYKVTFVTVSGETDASAESLGVTVVNNATNGQVAVNSIPLGLAGTTSRRLYRTVANGLIFKLLTTIANNTATTFTDNVADGSLGVDEPVENTTAPNGYKRIRINQDSIDWDTSLLDVADWQLSTKIFTWLAVNLSIGPVNKAFLTDAASGAPAGKLLLAFWDFAATQTMAPAETLGFEGFVKQK